MEDDIPEQFLHPDAVVCGTDHRAAGNWRYAAENSFDAGHANYLHRYGAVHSFFRKMPAWSHPSVTADEGGWLTVQRHALGLEAEYRGWARSAASLLAAHPDQESVVDPPARHRAAEIRGLQTLQLPLARARRQEPLPAVAVLRHAGARAGGGALSAGLRAVHQAVPPHSVQQPGHAYRGAPTETAPERLYRPDVTITAWRKLCEHARGEQPAAASIEAQSRSYSRSRVLSLSRDATAGSQAYSFGRWRG